MFKKNNSDLLELVFIDLYFGKKYAFKTKDINKKNVFSFLLILIIFN